MFKQSKKIAYISIFILMVFVLSGCGNNGQEEEEPVIKKQVEIQQIARQSEVSSSLVVSGTVVPKQYSLIRSLTPGTVQYLAPVGSEVVAGQPLFSIYDQGIETSYFNAFNTLEQTKVTTAQRVKQAELAVNSAKARLDLARSSYKNTVAQTEQNTRAAEDSALASYNSAYNTISRALNFLTEGSIENYNFVLNDLQTSESQLRSDTATILSGAVGKFLSLPKEVEKENLAGPLNQIHGTLLSVKELLDNSVIILQTAIPSEDFNSASISYYNSNVQTFQNNINLYLSEIISSINNITNTKINNRLSIENAQASLDLAQIEYNNSEIALQNAKDGAELEVNMSETQFDSVAYNYNNLSLSSPFSGTVLSHFVTPGEQISVGQELVEIGNLSLVEITVDVDVSFAKAIKLGDQVTIEDQYKGIVAEVEPIGDLQSGKVSVTVQSEQADENLVAGSIADVEFVLKYEEVNSIIIPIKSATIEASGNFVYVLEDGKVVRKNVTLGKIYGDKVSVESGLEEGDQLILLNGVFVSEGDEVEVVNQ